jgi:hypothetical protein
MGRYKSEMVQIGVEYRVLPYGPLKFQCYLNIRNILFGLFAVC